MSENSSDIQQHIERYRKLLERDPDSRVFAPLAEACRKANRLEEALAIAETGVRRHPTYASGRVALARAQLALDRHADAAGELAEALLHAPENALAHRLLGEARTRLGDSTGAFDAYARALALNPEDEEAREALAGFEAQPEAAPAEPEIGATGGEVPAEPSPDAPPGNAEVLEGIAAADDIAAPEGQPDPEMGDGQKDREGQDGQETRETEGIREGEGELALDLEPLRRPDEPGPDEPGEEGAHEVPEPQDPAPAGQAADAAVTDFGAAEIPEAWGAPDAAGSGEETGAAGADSSEEGPPGERAPEAFVLEQDAVIDNPEEDAAAWESDWNGEEPAFTGGAAAQDPAFETGFPDAPPDAEDDPASAPGPDEEQLAEAGAPAAPVGETIAGAAMGPLSKRLDALDIAASSLAPEAREAVPGEAAGPAEDPPEEALPLDRRVEELADQYLRLGYPDRARALYSSLLAGDPMNLHAKRKLREMGPEAGPPARPPAAGNQEVRRKVEENIDVLNRWLANIKKGAAR